MREHSGPRISPIRPKKRLGQHFLVDANTARKIAAAVEAPKEARVVEIGPGTGALTRHLIDRYPRMIAVEVDSDAVEHLRATIPDLDVRHADVLDLDWRDLAASAGDGRLHVVGNLPYNITSPILFSLIEARDVVERAVIMIQREVADRIVAAHGSKTYGGLSVQAQLLARPRMLFKVGRNVFFPRPDVESAVLEIDFRDAPIESAGEVDLQALRRVVRAAFGQRRKVLRNSLSEIAAEAGRELPERFAGLRPEQLAPSDFVDLTRALQ